MCLTHIIEQFLFHFLQEDQERNLSDSDSSSSGQKRLYCFSFISYQKVKFILVIAWGRVKLWFNFTRVFKVSQLARVTKRRGKFVKL